MSTVRLRGWGWRHPGRRAWAVRGVDLDVADGERVLVLGPSGAGKSTLLAGLAGLLDPEAGEAEGTLTVDGVDPRTHRGEIRTGMVMQDPEAGTVMARCGDDVAFGLENHAVPAGRIWPRVDEALEAVGFAHGRDHPTSRLSGGERQRLTIAGALALRPTLLLLDEPSANLDPGGAALVREVLAGVLADTGATLLLVEHRVAAALPLVDRVVVLSPGGGVLADGDPGRVFAGHGAALAEAGVWVPGEPPRPPLTVPAAAGPTLLTSRDLRFGWPGGPGPAVDGADVDLAAGQLVGLLGPNGSGKSTLALLLAGLLRPDAGSVHATPALAGDPRLAGRPVWRWRARDLVDRVGTVFQDPEHQFLTGRLTDELAVGPRRSGMPPARIAATVADLLERLRLSHLAEANPFTLSGGEKRRLSVATALAAAPRLLVLDEPTFGQDRRTWSELVDLLGALRADGTAVLAATHDAEFVAALADRTLTPELRWRDAVTAGRPG
jgi:energy-coupling factor transport system ATP-binding protein